MNKHVAKLLQPGVFWYCLIMLAFAAAAALFDQYYLAVGELVVTVIVMVVSRLLSVRRRNALMRYVQSATDAEGISVHAGSPFPMAVIRLPEGEIIWGNDGFYAITGLSDSTQYQTLDAVVPGFTTGWLREGRSELPGDQLIGARRISTSISHSPFAAPPPQPGSADAPPARAQAPVRVPFPPD